MVYFPSCNFTALRPQAAQRLSELLRARMPEAGCCRLDKTPYDPAETGLYLCQACRETLTGRLALQSLWVYLDGQEDFPLPDWSGLTLSVQDCWRDRDHPEIHRAVRSLLQKMGVTVTEVPAARERSRFCGDLHCEPLTPETRALLRREGDPYSLLGLPAETVTRLMEEQVAQFPQGPILTYCNRCTRGVEQGGGQAVHLGELVTGLWSA